MSNWFCISMLLRQRALENWSLPSWWAVPFRCLPSKFVYALPQFYFVVVSLVLDLKITLPFPLQTLHCFCLAGSCPCHIMQVHAFLCYRCCLRISYPAAPTCPCCSSSCIGIVVGHTCSSSCIENKGHYIVNSIYYFWWVDGKKIFD